VRLKIDFDSQVAAFPDGIPKTQCSNTAEGLREDGAKIRPLVKSIVSALINTANEDLECLGYFDYILMGSFEMAKPKAISRMNDKADEDYEGSFVDIRDAERGSVDLRRPEHIAAFCSVVDWAHQNKVVLPHNAVICITDNRFRNPTESGYSSHKANIVVPIPGEPGRHHIFELMTKNGEFERIIEQDKKNRLERGSHEAYDLKRRLDGRYNLGKFKPQDAMFYAQVYNIIHQIHANARRICRFDEIDFEPFMKHREAESLEELKMAIAKEI